MKFHVKAEFINKNDDTSLRKQIAYRDFEKMKDYIEKRLREFENSDKDRIIIDLEEIK